MDTRLADALSSLERVFKALTTVNADDKLIEVIASSVHSTARTIEATAGFDELDEGEREELGL